MDGVQVDAELSGNLAIVAPLLRSSRARTRRSAMASIWPRRPRRGRCCASWRCPLAGGGRAAGKEIGNPSSWHSGPSGNANSRERATIANAMSVPGALSATQIGRVCAPLPPPVT